MNEKLAAHQLVKKYPEKVIIEYECEHQGRKVHHHYDYSKPLNVHLLCGSCHRKTYTIRAPGKRAWTCPQRNTNLAPFLGGYLYRNRLTGAAFAKVCGISQPTMRLLGVSPVSRIVAEKVKKATGCSISSLVNPKGGSIK